VCCHLLLLLLLLLPMSVLANHCPCCACYAVLPLLQAYMERVHAPLLMQPLVQVLVVALFITGARVIHRQFDCPSCCWKLSWASKTTATDNLSLLLVCLSLFCQLLLAYFDWCIHLG
jgi:hypothetical protein